MSIPEINYQSGLKLNLHDHTCLLYNNIEEWEKIIIQFFKEGLKNNEKCVYLFDRSDVKKITKILENAGLDVKYGISKNQIVFINYSDSYTKNNYFDPEKMIEFLIQSMEKAKEQGFSKVRATGEMTWALHDIQGVDRILEYEAKLNKKFFQKYNCSAICQYDLKKFPCRIIKGAILTHPIIIYKNQTYNNLFYLSPDEVLAKDQEKYEVIRMLKTLEKEKENYLKLKENEINLEKTNKDLESFIYAVSHDLSAGLRRIEGFSDIILEDINDLNYTEFQDYFVRIHRNSKEMKQMLNGLLKLSRISRKELEFEKINISAMVDEILEEFENQIKTQRFKKEIEPNIIIKGDYSLIRIFLENILSNAIKFTQDDAINEIKIYRISDKEDPHFRWIVVEDNGVGFELEDKEEIFQLFKRMESAKGFPGMGIGLATVRKIIERHDAMIDIESTPNEGTKIFFKFE